MNLPCSTLSEILLAIDDDEAEININAINCMLKEEATANDTPDICTSTTIQQANSEQIQTVLMI